MGIGYDVLIVHYSEIFLKGPPVKRHFEQILIQRIRQVLDWQNYQDFNISLRDHSLWIYGSISIDMCPHIAKIFGVRSVLPVLLCQSALSAIKETSRKLSLLSSHESPLSYRVKAKKEKLISTSGKTIEIEISQYFSHWKLDLYHPEKTIQVVVKKKYAYMGHQRTEGPGGLPYGSSGKVIALVSKGIDSTVAAWLMAKRGCELTLLHFGKESIHKIQSLLETYSGKKIKVIQIVHAPFLQHLKDHHAGKYLCILCKVGMLFAAYHFSCLTGSKAIVTGENLGQVASQTLENLTAMTHILPFPILRPLISFDKEAIVNLSQSIGSFGVYENPSCAFVPDHPSTAVSSETLRHLIQSDTFQSAINEWKKYW